MACSDTPPSIDQTGPQELDGRGKTYVQLPILNVFGAHLLSIQSRDGMLDSDPLHAVLVRILVAALQGRFEMKYGMVGASQATIEGIAAKLNLGLGFDVGIEEALATGWMHIAWDEKGM